MKFAGAALRAALFLFLGIAPLSSGFAAPPPQRTVRGTTAVSTGGDWWKHALIYEIYPRSFQDSDGNGLGDLNGITTRLDYLNGVASPCAAPILRSATAL